LEATQCSFESVCVLTIRHVARSVTLSFLVLACDSGTSPDSGPRVTSVSIQPVADTLVPGMSVHLTAVARDAQGVVVPDARITWRSTSDAIAMVGADGNVSARAAGSATITAAGGGAEGQAKIVVLPALDEGGLDILDVFGAVLVGETAQVRAIIRGDTTFARNVVWSIADTSIAQVNAEGLVRGRALGVTTIRAQSGVRVASLPLHVVRLLALNIGLSPRGLLVGDTVRLEATGTSERGLAVPTLLWSSTDTAVAVVDSRGLVTARGGGSAFIVAAAHGKSASASIAVTRSVGRCAARGTREFAGTPTWTRAGSPYHVVTSYGYSAGKLTIEPGTVVCLSPGASFGADLDPSAAGIERGLEAIGTADQPIVFTAEDPSRPWGSIVINSSGTGPGGSARITHALIEHATRGVDAMGPAYVDRTHFRQIQTQAVIFSSNGGLLTRSVVDTAAIRGGPAVQLNGGTFEETVIRGSGGHGLVIGVGRSITTGDVKLLGGRIEGSAGDGLQQEGFRGDHVRISEARAMRVVGNKGYPAQITPALIRLMYPTVASQDSLLGNALDTLQVRDGFGTGEHIIGPRLPWAVSSTSVSYKVAAFENGSVLRMEPGASLTMAVVALFRGGRLVARGTAQAPVTIRGGPFLLSGTPDDTSYIANARLIGTHFVVSDAHSLVIDSMAAIDGASFELRSRGSRFTRSTIDRGGSTEDSRGGIAPFVPRPPAALVLGATGVRFEQSSVRASVIDGVLIDAINVVATQCRVSDNAGDGIRAIMAAGVQVRECNLERNGKAGVNNESTFTLSATSNWWGSAAGPTSPGGDGVSGNVQYIPFLTVPSAAAP
jgi:hypothetical protein